MSVSSLTSAPPTTPTTTNTASAATLTSNDFLKLLTTQLTNQNPLDPTDPNQFTTEMVQYGSLSQQIDMNTSLSSISDNLSSLLTQVSILASGGTVDAPASGAA